MSDVFLPNLIIHWEKDIKRLFRKCLGSFCQRSQSLLMLLSTDIWFLVNNSSVTFFEKSDFVYIHLYVQKSMLRPCLWFGIYPRTWSPLVLIKN